MEQYVPNCRVPGKINDYDLYPGYTPDYGPERTILQQKALYDISGEPKFLEYSGMFDDDMGEDGKP